MKTMILGGARSGKSQLAARIARDSGMPVYFIATATASDDAMKARIARHQDDRPGEWGLVEEPVALAGALRCGRPVRGRLADVAQGWRDAAVTRGSTA